MNQHHSATDESCSLHEKHHCRPTDAEQINFYVNGEDALSVCSGIFGVCSDFTRPASIKQSVLRKPGKSTYFYSLRVPLRDSVSLFLACLQVPKWVILAPSWFHLITNYMLVFSSFCWLNLSRKSRLHTNRSFMRIITDGFHSLPLCFSPPPPAASVSNLKSTMSPHSSILNTYPSNLRAAPITRICHGTHGPFASGLEQGWPRRGQRANMEDQVLDCSRG